MKSGIPVYMLPSLSVEDAVVVVNWIVGGGHEFLVRTWNLGDGQNGP